MSVHGGTEGVIPDDNNAPDEIATLREKLRLMQEIQALQLQLNPGTGHSRTQPTVKVKVPESPVNTVHTRRIVETIRR